MKKLKIGIDVDEVVVHTIKGLLEYIKEKRGEEFSLEEIHNYHLWNTKIHKSKEESIKEFNEYMESSFFENPTFLEGAKDSLFTLLKNHEIYFITARPLKFKEMTLDFFKKHFPKKNFNFFFSGEVYEGKTKGEICLELNIDIMIEDNYDYLRDCVEKDIKGILIEKPWNAEREYHEKIIRVKDWKEVLEKIREFEK